MGYACADGWLLFFRQVVQAGAAEIASGLLQAGSFCLAEKIFGSRWDRMFYKSKKNKQERKLIQKFEQILIIEVHFEFFQEFEIFFTKGLFAMVGFLIVDIPNYRIDL